MGRVKKEGEPGIDRARAAKDRIVLRRIAPNRYGLVNTEIFQVYEKMKK